MFSEVISAVHHISWLPAARMSVSFIHSSPSTPRPTPPPPSSGKVTEGGRGSSLGETQPPWPRKEWLVHIFLCYLKEKKNRLKGYITQHDRKCHNWNTKTYVLFRLCYISYRHYILPLLKAQISDTTKASPCQTEKCSPDPKIRLQIVKTNLDITENKSNPWVQRWRVMDILTAMEGEGVWKQGEWTGGQGG